MNKGNVKVLKLLNDYYEGFLYWQNPSLMSQNFSNQTLTCSSLYIDELTQAVKKSFLEVMCSNPYRIWRVALYTKKFKIQNLNYL